MDRSKSKVSRFPPTNRQVRVGLFARSPTSLPVCPLGMEAVEGKPTILGARKKIKSSHPLRQARPANSANTKFSPTSAILASARWKGKSLLDPRIQETFQIQ